jgi:hypothetical protein
MPEHTSNPLQMTFYIELTDSKLAKEGSAELAAWPPGRLDLEDISGCWQIQGEGLAEALMIEDDLINLGNELGVQAVQALGEGNSFEMNFDQSAGGIKLVPCGDLTEFFMNHQSVGKILTIDLIRELKSCTQRMATQLKTLAGQDKNVFAAALSLEERSR